MHVVSETEAAPAVITSKARTISGGVVGALAWAVVRIIDDFAFTVTGPGGAGDNGAATLHTSPAEFSTAHKAERAAKAWCEAWVPRPDVVSERGEFLRQASEVVNELRPATVIEEAAVRGWRIHVLDDRGGYQASLIADDDVTAVEVLPTCETHQDAVTAAIEWARANPRSTPVDVEPTPYDELGDEVPEPPPAPAEVATPRDEEIGQLRRELALARRERDAAVAGAAADFLEATSSADELITLEAERRRLLDVLEEAKLDLKALEKKLAGKAGAVAALVQSIGRGDRARVYQTRMTFADSAETKAVVGAAARASAALDTSTNWTTWAFNGVEHRICHEQVPSSDGPRFVAWLDGHRSFTDGHGETLEQAVDACKLAASTLFADMDPGQTTSEDTGAVADGPRKTAKRGRPAKLKGHDQAAVIAAVESVLTWPEAAALLSCTTDQLEQFAAKVGLNLAKHQGRRAGEELALPAAPQAKAGKPRGRKGGAT